MKRSLLTLFIAVTCALSTQAQEKITFKLNPEKGKTIHYTIKVNTDLEGQQNLIMDMYFDMHMTATAVHKDSITFEAKYTNVKTDMDMGVMKMSYDSSVEPTDEFSKIMGQQLKSLLENTMTMTMTTSGKVLNMDFPNVSAQTFDKSALASLSMSYPLKPIAIGDYWEEEKDLAQVNAKGKIKQTLIEKTAEGYKFNASAEFFDSTGKSIGTSTGYSIVSPTTFMTISSKVKTTMNVMGNKIAVDLDLQFIQ